MIDYTLEHKSPFILAAYGFPIQASLQDYRSLALEEKSLSQVCKRMVA